jgi:hypothetical protein
MADGLTTGLPTTGTALGRVLTDTLLRGWGADATDLDDAHRVAHDLTRPATGGDPR